ncbi:BirA family biotin operon repressor/biotin-[acetyl-CoA-carboxylase] ligase [Cerasibacillus quisquiliarum]|uniref:Bifunctional ligase/repressor BirA n=1 Tax=Cerasibacillus quisquiliarum TaxID=227865 RepID=A0A511V3B9_9BACI|nr:biotin--[acetyl-CoA-carboxylase] ligase [Cerasibacillus quisquiliarum]MBB5145356.1 BirA family biotin operon repressor/biotin-[acetyl-CoA-carboxylase] ligase [Cerasibacillus quisquiliarum]GEN31792.1 bifunctional ligase/repressor BirA [Cerasibacillus quisquiliarum]
MQSTRNKLIAILANNQDKYISGQYLSEKLDISRSAIWKHMKELEKDGYEIEARQRRGYRIVSFPNKLSENTLKWGLETDWLGHTIIHKTITTSTQHIAHQLAREGAEHGTIVIADEQTGGKGRMNRPWHSSKNQGIWTSLILRPEISPHQAPQLTLLTATVLADVIYQETNIRPYIKWPNDILIENKKLSGILTEMQAEQDRIQYIIIGIGMNINQTKGDLPNKLRETATSLKIETGRQINMLTLVQSILEQFEKTYEMYLHHGFTAIKNKWESYGFKIGEKINIKTMNREWEGTFSGIGSDGGLLVKNKHDGKIEKLYSAEIDWFRE